MVYFWDIMPFRASSFRSPGARLITEAIEINKNPNNINKDDAMRET